MTQGSLSAHFMRNTLAAILVIVTAVSLPPRAARAQSSIDTTASPWKAQYPPLDFGAPDRLFAVNDHLLYILSNGFIMRSVDTGATWQRYDLPGCFEASGATFMGDSLGWLVGDHGTMYKSTDGGATWIYHRFFLSAIDFRFVSFASPKVGWIGGTAGTIIKTTDGGDHWQFQDYWEAFDVLGVSYVNAITDSIAWLTHFSIVNNNGVLCDYSIDMVRTTDGGETWPHMSHRWVAGSWISRRSTGLEHCLNDRLIDVNTSLAISKDEGRLYIPSWTGYHTTTGGAKWDSTTLPAGAPVRFPKMFDATRGWATNVNKDSAFLYRSTNRDSMVWVRRTTPHNSSVTPNLYDFLDTLTGFCYLANGDGTVSIYRTTDGAATWQARCTYPLDNGTLTDVVFTSPDTGWAVGNAANRGLVMHTTDRGKHWSMIASGIVDPFQSVHFVNSQIGWALGDSIHVTRDGGHTWQVDHHFLFDTLRPNVRYVAVEFANANTGWVLRSDWMTYRTTDGGTSWSVVHDRDTAVTLTVGRAVSDKILMAIGDVGDSTYVFRILNGGGSTQQYPVSSSTPAGTNPPRLPCALFFKDSLNGWMMDTLPSLFSTTDGGFTWRYRASTSEWQAPGEMVLGPGAKYRYREGRMAFTDSSSGWFLKQPYYTWDGFVLDQFWVLMDGPAVVKIDDGGLTTARQQCVGHAQHGIAFVGDSLGWTVGDNLSVYNYYLPATARPHKAPFMVLSPPSIDFGTVQPGAFRTDSLKIYNMGNDTLKIFEADVTERIARTFNVGTLTPVFVPPGDSATIFMNFDPRFIGTYDDTLIVYSNDDTQRVLLRGVGDVVRDVSSEAIAAMRLEDLQNYPNPFSEETTIWFPVNGAATARPSRVTVSDAFGRTVADLTSSVKRGDGHVNFKAHLLPAGTYFCVAQFGDRTVSQRMVVVR